MFDVVKELAGEEVAGRLAGRFTYHQHLKGRPEGFPTAVSFLCPFCDVRGDDDQRNAIKRHILETHSNVGATANCDEEELQFSCS